MSHSDEIKGANYFYCVKFQNDFKLQAENVLSVTLFHSNLLYSIRAAAVVFSWCAIGAVRLTSTVIAQPAKASMYLVML